MANAVEIIVDALDDILVGADESTLEAAETRSALRALNRIMSRLAASGLELGYTEVSKLSDPITVAAGALDGITTLLALRLWPKYIKDAQPSAVLIDQALAGLKAIRNIAVSFPQVGFPDTLPIGSGNYAQGSANYNGFFPPDDRSILAEFGGSIGVEDATGE